MDEREEKADNDHSQESDKERMMFNYGKGGARPGWLLGDAIAGVAEKQQVLGSVIEGCRHAEIAPK